MSIIQAQEELKQFLAFHQIKYTEDRSLFSGGLQQSIDVNKGLFHVVWGCKLREWSNILSVNSPCDSEQYFIDFIRRISYVFRGQSESYMCRSACDEVNVFCCFESADKVKFRVSDLSGKLLEAASYSYEFGSNCVQNRLSVGVSFGQQNSSDAALHLINEAKIVMDQVTFGRYNSSYLVAMETCGRKPTRIKEKNRETKIKIAIKRKHFSPYYQPVVDIETGMVSGFECLARLEEGGELFEPSYFLGLIKTLQLTADLDIQICEKVIASIGIIHAKSPYVTLSFNINVSGDLMRSADKRRELLELISSAQLPSNKFLQIEIVEDSFEIEAGVLETFFKKLDSLGIRVYIDDFGLGFSSIDRLLSLPVYGVKLDSIFVSSVQDVNDKKNKFLAAVVEALSSSGLDIVAESVENESQLKWIKKLKVHKYQGYIASRPISLQDALLYISANEPRPKAIRTKKQNNLIDLIAFRAFIRKLFRRVFFDGIIPGMRNQ